MTISIQTVDGIAVVMIDRPDRRNALALPDWEALGETLGRAMNDHAVRIIILTGTPGHFCAGADIADMAENAHDADWRDRKQAAVRKCNMWLARGPKPAIAAINGDAIGGGCGLALACDFRIASPAARFGVTPAKLGIAYSRFDTKLLVDAVGPSEARALLYTAMIIDAEEAEAIGLIDRIVDDPLEAAGEMAEAMAELSQHSIGVAKAHISAILDGAEDDDEASIELFKTAYTRPEFYDRLEAFLNRKR